MAMQIPGSADDPAVGRVLVLGGGSAGFIAALTLKVRFPELEVTVVRSQEIGIIGVGESTTPVMPTHLHGYLGIDPGEFIRAVLPTWKLGIRFLWGERPFFDYTFGRQYDWKWERLAKTNGFYCNGEMGDLDLLSALMSADLAFVRKENGDPLIERNFGYHIDNVPFVAFLEAKARQVGIEIINDTLLQARVGPQGVEALHLASGQVRQADLYVDCSGFRSELLGKALGERYIDFRPTLFCDRAVTGDWKRTDEPIHPYTTAETMDAGWCWRIEHVATVIRGYVYSSAHLGDDEAEAEFRRKNPRLSRTWRVKFRSGRYDRSWVKNVVAVGNASGFVEPLEATSLHCICIESRTLAGILQDSDQRPTPTLRETYNRLAAKLWDEIRWFLGVHYKFNARLDTSFWKACRADVDIGAARAVVDYFQENGPSTYGRNAVLHPMDMFGMEGYLSLLIGQNVPHRRPYRPREDEARAWAEARRANRARAAAGMSVAESLGVITRPTWQWYPGYFVDDGVMLYNR
jgi:tryptophan halogenase